MSLLDKLWNSKKSEDDYDEYEDFEDEDEEDDDDYDDEPVRKLSFFKRKEKEYDYDLEDTNETKEVSKPVSSKITSITRKRSTGNGMEVCVIKPTTFEDAKEITETLRAGRAVVLNFEGLDIDLAQRIIDYTSGTCMAFDGNLRKISSSIFIVTPKSVYISGDLQDLLTDGFDAPEIKTDF